MSSIQRHRGSSIFAGNSFTNCYNWKCCDTSVKYRRVLWCVGIVMRRKSTALGQVRSYSCQYSCWRQSVMYWKAAMCVCVCCVYVNRYYIQRDRRIVNGHPLPAGEVYVYLHKFSNIFVFFINLNVMEAEVLTWYRVSSWPIIFFKAVQPLWFPELRLNLQTIRKKLCILRCQNGDCFDY